jgi:hypothetical protein
MANNFNNKIARNVSADQTLPTYLYSVPTSKKTIVIELDVSNRSTSSQTISVLIDDFTAKGANVASTAATISTNIIVTGVHGLTTGDRIRLTRSGTTTILNGGVAILTAGNNTDPVFYAIVMSTTSFKLASSHSNASAGTALTVTGTTAVADVWNSLGFTYIVRDAPLPIGGALKVIAGQKLVMDATDSMIIHASSASSVDAIASILEDVS